MTQKRKVKKSFTQRNTSEKNSNTTIHIFFKNHIPKTISEIPHKVKEKKTTYSVCVTDEFKQVAHCFVVYFLCMNLGNVRCDMVYNLKEKLVTKLCTILQEYKQCRYIKSLQRFPGLTFGCFFFSTNFYLLLYDCNLPACMCAYWHITPTQHTHIYASTHTHTHTCKCTPTLTHTHKHMIYI